MLFVSLISERVGNAIEQRRAQGGDALGTLIELLRGLSLVRRGPRHGRASDLKFSSELLQPIPEVKRREAVVLVVSLDHRMDFGCDRLRTLKLEALLHE